MAEYKDREHYIPLRKGDLIELLASHKDLPSQDRDGFRQLCTLVGAVFHFEYLERLEKLKDAFAPFDPDSQTAPLKPLSDAERERKRDEVFREFTSLMERANFKHLSRDDVQAAIEGGASDWGINMYVNWAVFDRLEIYARGDSTSTRTKRHAIFFWRKIEKEVNTYSRLVILVKLKPHKSLPEHVDTDDIFLKLFKDIPKLDLEMVLPGTQLQMPRGQRYKLGGSLLGTIGYAIWKMAGDILGFAGALVKGAVTAVPWGVFGVLAGYGYKQYYSYQVTKQTYSKMLTESLYFQTLDNNAGVLTRLLDEAEEQECREALLGYYCLWRFAPPEGWTAELLDDYVELFLEGTCNLKVDFEIGDALDKLERLGMVDKSGDHYRAAPLATALERLDYRWDNYFQYNKA